MEARLLGGASAFAVALALSASSAHAQSAACAALGSSLLIPNSTGLTTSYVSAGTVFPASPLGGTVAAPVSFCQVQVTLTPVPGSDIQLQVWLPDKSAWSGRFQGTGNGGFWGAILPSSLASGIGRGDATANSDQGHEGGVADASFIVGHPASFVDFGYRATHLMTLVGKQVTAAYYGLSPHYSYFNGCSSGGRQALKEAEMYPDDYNGILAGDPANDWVNLNVDQVYQVQVNEQNPAGTLGAAQYTILNNAVLAQCGATDGTQDPGFVANPLLCHFDPGVVQCKPGASSSSCLTKDQVETARLTYRGPIDERTGLLLFPGWEPGSETLWGPGGFSIADSFFKYFVFDNPNFNSLTLNYTSDITAAELQDHGVVGAVDSDLTFFATHGGKLIHYHGWADTTISPGSSTNFYQRTAIGAAGNTLLQQTDAVAPRATSEQYRQLQSYYRLFMVPGMGHCEGGPGPNVFGQTGFAAVEDSENDILTALEAWVEQGQAPSRIIATKFINDDPSNGVAFSRPLCPYPQTARYSGAGDPTNAANFVCVSGPQGPS